MDFERIVRKSYNAVVRYNRLVQPMIPEIAGFVWDDWRDADQMMMDEFRIWSEVCMMGLPLWTSEQRHSFAVANRLANGWVCGPEKDNIKKTDPYMIPFRQLPENVARWLRNKDLIFVGEFRRNLTERGGRN